MSPGERAASTDRGGDPDVQFEQFVRFQSGEPLPAPLEAWPSSNLRFRSGRLQQRVRSSLGTERWEDIPQVAPGTPNDV